MATKMLGIRINAIPGASLLQSSSSNSTLFNTVSFYKVLTSPSNAHRFNFASLRCFASAAMAPTGTIERIKVQNPVVEMDGNIFG